MRPKGTSWSVKLFALLFVLSVTPVVAVSVWSFDTLVASHQRASIQSLQALARAKSAAVDQFTELRRRDVERMASLLAPYLVRLQEKESTSDLQRPSQTKEQKAKAKAEEEELPDLVDAEDLPKSTGTAASDRSAAARKERRTAAKQPPGDAKTAGSSTGEAPASRPARSVASPPDPDKSASVAEASAVLKQTLGLILWDQSEFEELLLIDSEGHVVISTHQEHQGKTAENLEYFQRGGKTTYLQPVFQSPITGELTMIISTPIRDDNLEKIGVLAARLNLKQFFQLINDNTGLGATGETVVAKKIDDEIAFMAPTRHDAKAALKRMIPVGHAASRALQEAARGQTGDGEQLDYRGKVTYAAWRYIPSLDWGLMTKMDREEVLQGLETTRERVIVVTLLTIVLVVVASLVASRALVRPLNQLKEATDKISRGDFAVELNIRSHDEIGDLADSFERMVAAIRFFKERSRSEEEDLPDEAETPPSP